MISVARVICLNQNPVNIVISSTCLYFLLNIKNLKDCLKAYMKNNMCQMNRVCHTVLLAKSKSPDYEVKAVYHFGKVIDR